MQTSGGLLLGQRQTLTLYKTQTIYSLCEQLVANFKKGGGGGIQLHETWHMGKC